MKLWENLTIDIFGTEKLQISHLPKVGNCYVFYNNSEKCYCAVLRYIALSLVKSFIGAKDVSIDTRSINQQVIRDKYNWKSIIGSETFGSIDDTCFC